MEELTFYPFEMLRTEGNLKSHLILWFPNTSCILIAAEAPGKLFLSTESLSPFSRDSDSEFLGKAKKPVLFKHFSDDWYPARHKNHLVQPPTQSNNLF